MAWPADLKDQDAVLAESKRLAEQWLAAFRLDGIHDHQAILDYMIQRGSLTLIVDDPTHAPLAVTALFDYLDSKPFAGDLPRTLKENFRTQLRTQLKSTTYAATFDNARTHRARLDPKEASQRIWDYYDAAFFACTPGEGFEMFHDRLGAFREGLGYVIDWGPVAVCVTLPEAYRDDQLRIHREGGPAILWGSYRSWWWHGVEVPQEWIEQGPTKQDFLDTSTNMEKRRVVCEIIGWETVLGWIEAKELQADDYGKLLEAVIDDDDGKPARFCDVQCPSSGRRYVLRVPPETETCRKGLAWSAQCDPSEYEFHLET